MCDETPPSEDSEQLSIPRRSALGLIGAAGLGTAFSGNASADQSTNGGPTTGNQPWYEWDGDVDANENGLYNLGSIDVDHTHISAREAEIVVWSGDEDVYYADSSTETVDQGEEPMAVIQAAVNSLDDDRTTKKTILVADSITVSEDHEVTGVELPSHTRLDIAGEITVDGEIDNDIVSAYGAENLEIPRLTVRGAASTAIFLDNCSDVTMGQLWIEDTTVQGVRIQENSEDIQINTAFVRNTGHHGIETYTVNRIQIGQVIGVDPGSCVVLLNETVDATVGQVIGRNPAFDYATFRLANSCRNVSVGRVVSRGGIRGMSIITGTRDVTVGEVNIQGGSKAGILLVDVRNVKILGGIVKNNDGPAINFWSLGLEGTTSEINEGITLANLRIVDERPESERQQTVAINERGACLHNQFINNDLRDGGTEELINVASDTTVVHNNLGGGIDEGTVTLESGVTPAARIEGVDTYRRSNPTTRTTPHDVPSASFAYESYVEWNGETEQWDLVYEWRTDPGTDVDVNYIVDRPRATIGRQVDREAIWEEGVNSIESGTYRITAAHSDLVLEVTDGSESVGANVQMGEWENEPHQRWEVEGSMDGRLGEFTLSAEHSGRGIEFDGENAVQGSLEEYTLERYEDGFRFDAPDGRVEVADASDDPGANVRVGEWEGGAHQIWQFERL